MHTKVENEVHSNKTLIIRLSWQKKKEKELCCADFLFFISRGNRKSRSRMEEEDGGVQTLCEAYNIFDSEPDEHHLKKPQSETL